MSLNSEHKFLQAMNKLGLIAPLRIIADEKLHLCRFESDSQISDDGWYIFSKNKPAMGLFGCWGLKRSRRWVNKKYENMSADERSDYIDRLYVMRKERNNYRTRHRKTVNNAKTTKCSNNDLSQFSKGTTKNDENLVDIYPNSQTDINKCFHGVNEGFTHNVKIIDKDDAIGLASNYVAQKRSDKNCKGKCRHCEDSKCQTELVNFLCNNFGGNTIYRVPLLDIGIIMGFKKPVESNDKGDERQKEQYIKVKNQIKSQVERWKNRKVLLH